MNTTKEKKEQHQQQENLNKDWQGIDKAPGEEAGKGEKVTKEDLKNKTVDRDITEGEIEPRISDIL